MKPTQHQAAILANALKYNEDGSLGYVGNTRTLRSLIAAGWIEERPKFDEHRRAQSIAMCEEFVSRARAAIATDWEQAYRQLSWAMEERRRANEKGYFITAAGRAAVTCDTCGMVHSGACIYPSKALKP